MKKQYSPEQKSALKKCLEAENLIKTAKKKQNDPHLILQAMDIYQEVLEIDNLQLAEPFVGIAYLMFSVGKVIPALNILQSALELEPQNKRVKHLYQQIETSQNKPKVSFDKASAKMEQLKSQRQENILKAKKNIGEIKPASSRKNPSSVHRDTSLPDTITHPLGLKPPWINKGSPIEDLQILLMELGYDRVKVTGKYDRYSFVAVQAFQKKKQLKVTGLVDLETQQVLNQELRQLKYKS